MKSYQQTTTMFLIQEWPLTLFFFTVLLVLLVIYLREVNRYWSKIGIAQVKPELLFGNARDLFLMRTTFDSLIQSIYQRLDGLAAGGFYLMTRPYLMFRDPHLIERVKVWEAAHFDDGQVIQMRFCGYPPGAHIIHSDSSRHREVRRRVAETFGTARTRRTFFLLRECCDRVTHHLQLACNRPGPFELELRCTFARFATDVIGRCAFGIECGAIDDPTSQFVRLGKKVGQWSRLECLLSLMFLSSPKLVSRFLRRNLQSEGHELFSRVFKETLVYREKNGVHQDDVIQLLLQIKNGELCPANGKTNQFSPPSDDALVSKLFMLFVVGFEMTSSVLSFCTYELAADQAVQTRARLEVDAVLRKHGGQLTYDAVMEMEYLEAVLLETLRLYPPIAATCREVSVPYTVPGVGVTLRAGDAACVPMAALHRDARFFPSPLQFRPERFLDEKARVAHRGCYLPFGSGPRECIGKHFAMVEMKAVMASLLSRFELCPSLRAQGRPANAAGAGRDLWVRLSPRIWYTCD